MSRKRILIALIAVALGIAAAVSSAQAGARDDDGYGGSKIGPFGQRFGGHHFRGLFAFARWHGRHHPYYYYH